MPINNILKETWQKIVLKIFLVFKKQCKNLLKIYIQLNKDNKKLIYKFDFIYSTYKVKQYGQK